jgi:hypothetical protein
VQWSLLAYAVTYIGLLVGYVVVITQLAGKGAVNVTGMRR